jgi:hypothetical protein
MLCQPKLATASKGLVLTSKTSSKLLNGIKYYGALHLWFYISISFLQILRSSAALKNKNPVVTIHPFE